MLWNLPTFENIHHNRKRGKIVNLMDGRVWHVKYVFQSDICHSDYTHLLNLNPVKVAPPCYTIILRSSIEVARCIEFLLKTVGISNQESFIASRFHSQNLEPFNIVLNSRYFIDI